jgi:GntR family transcriptional regulator
MQADIRVETVPAPRRTADSLKVAQGAPLVKIERVTLANGSPIALMTNWLLPEIVPDIARRIGGMDSLYSFLESEYGLVIEAATDFISARQAGPGEASRLALPAGSPLLVVRRISHAGGRPIEEALLLVVADRYEYCVHTQERPPRPPSRQMADRPAAEHR